MQRALPTYQPSDKTNEITSTRSKENGIGEVFRSHGESYIDQYSPSLQQIKLIRAIRLCKTPTLGGKALVCKKCGNQHHIYLSCGHSHCPICQSIKREQWIDKLKGELLKVPYVHMIFTLPHELNGLARNNKGLIYSLIMKSSWGAIKELSNKLENIGGLPGAIIVLHTFGSDMKYHIHTHCLVTFGALDIENKWRYPQRKDKIARYGEIKKAYKTIFLKGLKKMYQSENIKYHQSYEEVLDMLGTKSWVVHNTKPTMDTKTMENYLARYINRVAISNNRVEYIKSQEKVKIIYNDYAKQESGKPAPKAYKMINPLVFIDQFIQHVLPPYFQKSRRYGLHANATKKGLEDKLPESIKRNGQIIRTIFEIITQLIKEEPYKCEQCDSDEYDIIPIAANKEWIKKYMGHPKCRSPDHKIKHKNEYQKG